MESDLKALNLDDIQSNFSIDKKLGQLLKTVVKEVNNYAVDQIRHIKKLSEIGRALSIEKDSNKLFEMIVDEARRFCNAEAGTLYIVDKEDQNLKFEILQNEAMDIRMGGYNGKSIYLPNVPLCLNNQPNHSNVSSHVALTGNTVNIPDIYNIVELEEFKGLDFTGTRNYDKKTGYRTQSMLVIPMMNHENDIIGVLQLINARDEDTDMVIAFSAEYVDIISSLASQAAVALTNVQLIRDLKDLFYAFIQSIATAIDEKSAYTGGHIKRVAELTMMIAKIINGSKTRSFKDIHLNEDQMEELRIAAWMHDVGKITTPEYIVDKSTKLETIFDRLHLVESRFALIEASVKNDYLNKKINLLETGHSDESELKQLEAACFNEISRLQDDFEFIKSCNNTGDFMPDDKIERLKMIGRKTCLVKGRKVPVLSKDEIYNLCIRKGTLTKEERKIIENHAKMTLDITRQLPFPKNLSKVPEYAAAHHEKLDGSGYPKGLCGDMLPLQSRILVIADIFEALTARDRPYKKPMSLSQAMKILDFMRKDNHIDSDILDLFIRTNTHLKYAKKQMNPDQIDIEI
jgi:HD-GYP domain-containing protein (c-di-GMP phosphodiesterase class II)